jgi:hypothetical protein
MERKEAIMPEFSMPDMAGYQEVPKMNGRATVEVTDISVNDRSIRIEFTVVDYLTHKGSQTIPEELIGTVEGKKISYFLSRDTSNHRDGGKFARRMFYECMTALGMPADKIDTDKLIGRSCDVVIKVKKDGDGLERESIAGFCK